MFKLKSYICKRSRPKEYLSEDCLIFCSRCLSAVETQENRSATGEVNESSQGDENSSTPILFRRKIGIAVIQSLDPIKLMNTYRYVLFK